MSGPLSGIRITGWSSMVPGPGAAVLIGDRSFPNRSGGTPAMFAGVNRYRQSHI